MKRFEADTIRVINKMIADGRLELISVNGKPGVRLKNAAATQRQGGLAHPKTEQRGMLISEEGMMELKKHGDRKRRIRELLDKYPEPWVIEKEPHDYPDGTNHFTYVRYRGKPAWAKGEEICVEIGSHVTPDLAELLILLREHAIETI